MPPKGKYLINTDDLKKDFGLTYNRRSRQWRNKQIPEYYAEFFPATQSYVLKGAEYGWRDTLALYKYYDSDGDPIYHWVSQKTFRKHLREFHERARNYVEPYGVEEMTKVAEIMDGLD